MKIGPDGSFPRITSTSKGIIRSTKIVEVPDEEKEESGLLYKLVWIDAVEDDCELSDKSESNEELSTDEDVPVQLPVENTEKSTDIDCKAKVQVEINEPLKKSPKKQSARNAKIRNRYRKIRNRNKYNEAKRNFNTSSTHYNYNSTYKCYNASTSNIENKYKYKSNNNFGVPSNFKRSIQPFAKSNDLEPWATPPVMLNTVPNYQHLMYPYVPAVKHIGHAPSNSNANNSMESFGILGDSPYDHRSPNFQSNGQNDNFMYNANYWNNGEYRCSANYHGYAQTYFQRRKRWNKNGKKNRNPSKSRKQNMNGR